MKDISALHNKALQAARDYKTQEAKLLEAIIDVDKEKVFERKGYPSLYSYCIEALKLSEAHSFALIGVARKSLEIPALKEKLETGEIHLSNARRIVPVLNLQNQSEWLAKAATLSQRQLENELVKVNPRECLPKEMVKPLTTEWSELRVSIPTALEEKLRRVKDILSQQMQKPVALAEALELLADRFLDARDPVRAARRSKRSLERLERLSRTLSARSDQSELVARPVESESKPAMKNGNRTAVPAAVRHSVNTRDAGQCTAVLPNGKRCAEKRWLQRHHKKEVSIGGQHSVDNLETLCSAHHRQQHRGRTSRQDTMFG